MVFLLLSIVVPLSLAVGLPRVTDRFGAKGPRATGLLLTTCLLFFISWYLPSPLVFGQDTHASQHFFGGGLFTGFLWLYAKQRFNWRRSLIIEALSLYALICVLGVSNELLELAVVKLGIADITLSDTSIDLLVNTCGAAVVFITYVIVRRRAGPKIN